MKDMDYSYRKLYPLTRRRPATESNIMMERERLTMIPNTHHTASSLFLVP